MRRTESRRAVGVFCAIAVERFVRFEDRMSHVRSVTVLLIRSVLYAVKSRVYHAPYKVTSQHQQTGPKLQHI